MKSVLVTIEMREAIPVRALPFVLKWKHPMAVARELARIADRDFPGRREYAYTWNDRGTLTLVLPHYWQVLVAAHERQTHMVVSPGERMRVLPPAVFMWRDGFEEAFNQLLTGYPPPRLSLRPSGFTFRYDVDVGEELWTAIMEGFDPPAVQTIAVVPESAPSAAPPVPASVQPEPGAGEESSGPVFRQRVQRLKKWLASNGIPPGKWRDLGDRGYSLSSVYDQLKEYPEFRSNSGRGEPIGKNTFERKFWREQGIAKISGDG